MIFPSCIPQSRIYPLDAQIKNIDVISLLFTASSTRYPISPGGTPLVSERNRRNNRVVFFVQNLSTIRSIVSTENCYYYGRIVLVFARCFIPVTFGVSTSNVAPLFLSKF